MTTNGVTIESHVSQLNTWLQNCNEHHDEDCQAAPIGKRPSHHIPDWVIDTEDACVVRGCSVPRYVALSYVWGHPPADSGPYFYRPTEGKRKVDWPANIERPVRETDGDPNARGRRDAHDSGNSRNEGSRAKALADGDRLMLLKDNLDDFCTKGFLQTDVLDKVPAVVRDAINLVRCSKVRYLWVDCLCIVQYDDTTRDRVGLMNEIYSGSYFTIIAAAKSTRGLYGLHPNHRRYFDEDKPSASRLHERLLCSHWASRGWTFQEQLLSKRAMVFLDDVYFWDCRREVQCPRSAPADEIARKYLWTDRNLRESREDCYSIDGRRRIGKGTLQRKDTPPSAPDLKLYVELVCRYNNRQLTYDQDALPAFSGVIEELSQGGFVGGFICGLPAILLDSALLWQPTTVARRRSVTESAARLAPKAPLPSWSWVGWQCRIAPDHLLCDWVKNLKFDENRDFPTCTVEKLVDWSTVSYEAPFSDQSPINEPGLMQGYKASRGPRSPGTLPPEWSYKPGYVDPVTIQYHPSAFVQGNTTGVYYRYPLPARNTGSAKGFARNGSLISCTTKRALFRARRVLVPYTPPKRKLTRKYSRIHPHVSIIDTELYATPWPEENCPVVTLEDSRGRWAGTLQIMDSETIIRSGLDLELIAISTGSRPCADADRPYPEEVDSTGSWYYPFDRRKHQPQRFHFKPLDSPTFEECVKRTFFNEFRDPFLEETQRHIDEGIDVGPFARRWASIANGTQSRSLKRKGPEKNGELQPAEETEQYQYYNVLWVDIMDGIMYRKAAGRVPKEIWEQNCGEPERIVLG